MATESTPRDRVRTTTPQATPSTKSTPVTSEVYQLRHALTEKDAIINRLSDHLDNLIRDTTALIQKHESTTEMMHTTMGFGLISIWMATRPNTISLLDLIMPILGKKRGDQEDGRWKMKTALPNGLTILSFDRHQHSTPQQRKHPEHTLAAFRESGGRYETQVFGCEPGQLRYSIARSDIQDVACCQHQAMVEYWMTYEPDATQEPTCDECDE